MSFTQRPRSQFGTRFAFATGHHRASWAAIQTMQRGGGLVDAAIAASAVLTVALPHATSLGGCGMLLYRDAASGGLWALNGSGRAPLAADPALFATGMPRRGARAWVTPTLVRCWARAHERFGRLPWATLFDEAIDCATDGGVVAEELARNLAGADAQLLKQAGFAQAFLPGGQPLRCGERFAQPRIAEVLRIIAAQGENGFYRGPVAASLLDFARAQDGLLSADDFAAAQADWSAPRSQRFDGRSVHVMPPNSVGVLMLAQLAAAARRPRTAGDDEALLTVQRIRIAAEVIGRLKNEIGDPEHGAVDPTLLESGHLDRAPVSPASVRVEPGDTSGIVAIDAQGNALAMLQSVFQPFGSGCVDPGTGILMNNRAFDFSTEPGSVNCIAPGKRPSHTLNPYLVQQADGCWLAGVSPGGVSQTTTGVQVLAACADPGVPLGEVVARPRWSLSRDGEVLLEAGLSPAVAENLRQHGMAVVENSMHEFYFGSAKLARQTPAGFIEAAADARRQAVAFAC